MYGYDDLVRLRRVLTIVGVWAATLCAVGLVAFSAYRVLLRPHPAMHEGYEVAIALGGLVVAPVGLLGVAASGTTRWLLSVSSLALTGLWFLSVLDNIN